MTKLERCGECSLSHSGQVACMWIRPFPDDSVVAKSAQQVRAAY